MNYDTIIFVVEGGLGKNIMATVPLRNLRKKYSDKEIVVVCGYPEVFQGNTNVDRIYHFANPLYFFEDYIQKRKSLIFKVEPYTQSDFVYRNKHMTEIWCDQIGVEFDNNKPDYFITKKEERTARQFVSSKNKPLIIMQISGGPIPKEGEPYKKVLVRDFPETIAQEIVDTLNKDYHVLLVRHPTQPAIQNTEPSFHGQPKYIPFSSREIISLIPHAKKILVIDSFMQHAARALEFKSTVLWGNTSPKVLGYDFHNNLTREVCKTPYCYRQNTYLFDCSQIPNTWWECPYGEECINYTSEEILKALA